MSPDGSPGWNYRGTCWNRAGARSWVPTGPADEREAATLLFMQAILGARERIWIASPYFVPDRDLLMALELARWWVLGLPRASRG